MAKSSTPTAGLVTVPTKPLPKPVKRPPNPSLEIPTAEQGDKYLTMKSFYKTKEEN